MTLEDLVNNNMYPRKAKGEGEVWVRCPFCGDDKYRMGINVISGLAHCFRASCEWKTTDRRFLFRELSKVFNVEERMDDVRYKAVKKTSPSSKRVHLPKEFERLLYDGAGDEIEQRALLYLFSRGVTWEQIKKHKLGFCAVGDFAWRIIIPVYRKDKLVAYTGRDFSGLPDIDPKYRNSEGTKYLYNIPRSTRNHRCVLFEGVFDVWAGERALDSSDSIGRLGAGLTKSSMQDLENYEETVIWPDPDKGGVELAVSAASALTKKGRKASIVMPEEDDVDPGKLGETEYGLQELAYKIRGRTTWSEAVRMKLRLFAAFV